MYNMTIFYVIHRGKCYLYIHTQLNICIEKDTKRCTLRYKITFQFYIIDYFDNKNLTFGEHKAAYNTGYF